MMFLQLDRRVLRFSRPGDILHGIIIYCYHHRPRQL